MSIILQSIQTIRHLCNLCNSCITCTSVVCASTLGRNDKAPVRLQSACWGGAGVLAIITRGRGAWGMEGGRGGRGRKREAGTRERHQGTRGWRSTGAKPAPELAPWHSGPGQCGTRHHLIYQTSYKAFMAPGSYCTRSSTKHGTIPHILIQGKHQVLWHYDGTKQSPAGTQGGSECAGSGKVREPTHSVEQPVWQFQKYQVTISKLLCDNFKTSMWQFHIFYVTI